MRKYSALRRFCEWQIQCFKIDCTVLWEGVHCPLQLYVVPREGVPCPSHILYVVLVRRCMFTVPVIYLLLHDKVVGGRHRFLRKVLGGGQDVLRRCQEADTVCWESVEMWTRCT